MTNLEPIVRKLIETHIHKYYDESGSLSWCLTYGREFLKKESFPDETINQAVDWFYFNVLQCENKEEA